MRFFATPPIDGAFAEYLVVHAAFAHPVPDALSDDAAALLEPLSVGVWACRKGRVTAGSRVLITGAGPIGLVSVQTALAFGATEVVVSDVNPGRLDLAEELGATEVVDARTTSVTARPRCSWSARGTLRRPLRRSVHWLRADGRSSSAWEVTSYRCRCRWSRNRNSR
jgi:L-iditol 2-dehydrogenase